MELDIKMLLGLGAFAVALIIAIFRKPIAGYFLTRTNRKSGFFRIEPKAWTLFVMIAILGALSNLLTHFFSKEKVGIFIVVIFFILVSGYFINKFNNKSK